MLVSSREVVVAELVGRVAKATTKVVINTKRWDEIRKKLRVENEHGLPVKIGIFETAGTEKSGLSIVEIAALHEFGSPGGLIPERSFLRQPLRNAGEDLQKVAKRVVKSILSGKITYEQGMGLLGQWGVSVCKKAIVTGDGIPPPNAPSTIAKKGSSRPLFDTGRLLNSISYQVEGGEHGGGSESGGSDPESDGGEEE